MTRKYFILLVTTTSLTLLCFCKCSTSKESSQPKSDSLYFNFCNFPQNLNQQVRILGNYSGIEEYWSIYSSGKCKNQIKVDFDINAIYDKLTSYNKKLFSEVHSKYWKYYLQVDATGRFEMNGKGYGHLGHNQAVFIPDKIISLELKEGSRKSD
jgi:hypothetical protein